MDLDAAKTLALQLMKEHLLLPEVVRRFEFRTRSWTKVIVPAGTPWKFAFDRGRRRFGCCHFGLRTITLSRALVLLNPERQVRDTILHEIAHASTAGPHANHGPKWRAEAQRLGCAPDRCYSSDKVVTPVSPWMGWCPGCKKKFPRYRRPPAHGLSCGICSPRVYNSQFQLQWARTVIADSEAYAREQDAEIAAAVLQ